MRWSQTTSRCFSQLTNQLCGARLCYNGLDVVTKGVSFDCKSLELIQIAQLGWESFELIVDKHECLETREHTNLRG